MAEPEGVARLQSLSEPKALWPYLADLWHRRQFTMSLATGDIQARHLDTILGNVWHVLNPVLSMFVYYLVFGVILGTDRGLDNFIGFLAVGIFTFSFMQRTATACGSSIPNNIGLIRSLQFPRAVLPLSAVVRELSDYGFAAMITVVIMLLTREPPTLSWLLTPVIVVLMTLFSTGLGLFVARLTDSVRDIANVLPFAFRLVFYTSGIIFALPVFVTDGAIERLRLPIAADQLRLLFVLDPFFTYIELLRDALMATYDAEHLYEAWLAGIIMAPVTFVLGLLYFRGGERQYGRG